MHQNQLSALSAQGFLILSDIIDRPRVTALINEIASSQQLRIKQQTPRAFAIRDLLSVVPMVRELAASALIKPLADAVLGAPAKLVRGIFFDKTREANWKVAWHQDLTIAVKARLTTPGFTAWSEKAGITHTQPPVALLEQMLIVRVHLDDTDADNGALKVLPGSHRYGRLAAAEIEQFRAQLSPVVCKVAQGGVLLMRPLLLHASSTATRPSHRRVIHLEFAAPEIATLPGGLAWQEDKRSEF